jgi:hypothetical protein
MAPQRDRVRAVQDDQPVQPIGVVQRDPPRYDRAPVVTDQRHPLAPGRLDVPEHVDLQHIERVVSDPPRLA